MCMKVRGVADGGKDAGTAEEGQRHRLVHDDAAPRTTVRYSGRGLGLAAASESSGRRRRARVEVGVGSAHERDAEVAVHRDGVSARASTVMQVRAVTVAKRVWECG